MTNDLFSMFNIVDQHEEEKRKQEEIVKAEQAKQAEEEQRERAAKLKAQLVTAEASETEEDPEEASTDKKESKPKPKKEAAPKFVINEDTVIRYHPDEIPVTKYFTVEEITEGILVKGKEEDTSRTPITAEMVRKRMENDYPELQPNFVDIVYLEKQNIICPYPKAKKKGALLSDCEVDCRYSSTVNGKSGWNLSKIPFRILQEFLGIASIMAEQKLEVHADIYYCPERLMFFMDVPKQRVHKYWVEVNETSQVIAERVGGATKVLEIHSHHTLEPFPSQQDNESERFPGMVYVIVGNMQNFFPDITIRQFISEEAGHMKMDIDEVFIRPFTELPLFEYMNIERG